MPRFPTSRAFMAVDGFGSGGAAPTLADAVTTWQDARTDLIHVGGLEFASWLESGSLAGNAASRTFIEPSRAIRQDTTIKQAKVETRTRESADETWSFRLYRYNGSTYDYVAKQDFTAVLDGQLNTVTCDMAAQIGDVPGIHLPATASNTLHYGTVDARDPVLRYVNGDILTTDAFALTLANTLHGNWEFLGLPPFLVVLGDSIAEGHNVSATATLHNHSGLHADSGTLTQPWSVVAADIAAQLRALVGDGSLLEYQNLSRGSTGFSWASTTGITEALAVKPNSILIHTGVNDVNNSVAWGTVEGYLDTIKAALTTENLFIDEILPWTAGDDTQAGTIRTFNANLATWCAANGATLIACHDAMGQTRVATGELDDLKTAYDRGDGVHLSTVGVAALAAIWKSALEAVLA